MSRSFSDMLGNSQNSQYNPISNRELNVIKNNITKLDKIEQLEILKIIKNNNDRITENKNGVFINLSNISKECIETINTFIQYSIDNKKRLQNLEKLSDNLLKTNILKNQYEDYNNLSKSKDYENKRNRLDLTNLKDNCKEYDDRNYEHNQTNKLNDNFNNENNSTTHIDGNNSSKITINLDSIINNIDDDFTIDDRIHIEDSINNIDSIEDSINNIDSIDEFEELNIIKSITENNTNITKSNVLNNEIYSIQENNTDYLIELPLKKNKFTGRNARILKKCKELTRNHNSINTFYGSVYDVGSEDSDDNDNDNDNDNEIILIYDKNTKNKSKKQKNTNSKYINNKTYDKNINSSKNILEDTRELIEEFI